MESIDDLNLKCLAGLSIMINEYISIRPKILKEIIQTGYDNYNKLVGIILVNENEINTTVYQYLKTICLENEANCDFVLASLQYLFEINMAVSEMGFAYIDEKEEFIVISEDIFNEAVKIIKIQNCVQVKTEEEYNPANERARLLIEKIKKNRENAPKVKDNTSLQSIISGVAWKSYVGISVWDLTIYQLYDAYNRLQLIDNYNNVQNGIYTGNIDQSKINFKDLSWSKTIK